MGISIRSAIRNTVLSAIVAVSVCLLLPDTSSAVSASLSNVSPNPSNEVGAPMFHRMRINSLGQHNAVELIAYFNAADIANPGTIRFDQPSTSTDIRCDYRLANGVSPSQTIVRLTIEGRPTINISAAELCTSNGLYKSFNIPAITTAISPDSGKHEVNIKIEYSDINLLDKAVSATDRNAIGFRATLSEGSAKLGPNGTGQRNFSVLADTGNRSALSSVKIPFGLPCRQTTDAANEELIIYDADVAGFGNSYVSVYEKDTDTKVTLTPGVSATSQNGSGGKVIVLQGDNKEKSTMRMTLQAGHQYVLVLSELSNGNTVDIGLPRAAVHGDLSCWDLYPHSRALQSQAKPGMIVKFEHWVDNTKQGIANNRTGSYHWGREGVRTNQIGSDFTRDFAPGRTNLQTRSLTIPASATIGQRFCQYTAINKAASYQSGARDSDADDACVTVGSCPPGDPACTPVVVQRQVTLRGNISTPTVDIEPGETARFNGSVTVSGFPELDPADGLGGEWGYNEQAKRLAINQAANGNTWGQPIAETYDAPDANGRKTESSTEDGYNQNSCANEDAAGNVTAWGWANNCTGFTHFVCGNGSATRRTVANGCGSNAGYYEWRCVYGSDIWGYEKGQTGPGCKTIYDWRCWGSDNIRATQHTRPSNLCTRWSCNSPSSLTWNDMNNPPGTFACHLWKCANAADPAAPGGTPGAAFYSDELTAANMFETDGKIVLIAQKCMPRCSDGTGDRAPLDNAAHSYDVNCYLRPAFDLACSWVDGATGAVTAATSEHVTADGTYCAAVKDEPGAYIGQWLCYAFTPSSTPGWYGLPNGAQYAVPGNARNENWTWTYAQSSASCVPVVAKPAFNVFGGDVSVGAGQASGLLCTNTGRTSSIFGWPHEPVYNASNTNLAAFASGNIDGFATAYNNPDTGAPTPSGLAFASSGSPTGTLFGGGYRPTHCIPDYYGNMPPDVKNSPSIQGLLNGVGHENGAYSWSGSQTINSPVTVPVGKKMTLYVDGDLTIEGNITYASRGSWGPSLDNIPAIRFIVRGNIYIAPGVTQLDGFYSAQPRAGASSSGYIYTCAIGGVPVQNDQLYNQCRGNKLTVNGVFSARQVNLMRSTGTARAGDRAEEFRYLPELWQTDWAADNTTLQLQFDSITSLPPIL